MKMSWQSVKRLGMAMAMAAVPLELTVSCDPYSGALDIYRYDDHHHGFFDIFHDDHDDCFFFDCYDDYYYEEVYIF